MALTSNQLTSAWSLGPNDVMGAEVPISTNPNIATYGYRTIAAPGIVCAAGSNQLAYVTAVEGDSGRNDAEILTIMQMKSNPVTPASFGGIVVRASGAAGSENGYFVYADQQTSNLIVGKFVAGVVTGLAGSAMYPWPTTDEDWYIRFRVNGSTISMRAFRYDAVEPTTWDVSITDTDITGVGHVGFLSACVVANNCKFHLPGFIAIGTSGESAPRPMSDIEQRRWLNDDSNPRVVLAEIGVLGEDVNGAAVPSLVTISNWPFVTKAADTPPNQPYDDIMVTPPTFTSKVSQQLTGHSAQSTGDCVVKNENGKRDSWLAYNWDGRSFDVFVGGLGWRRWDFIHTLSAATADIYVPAKDQLGFSLRDKSALLNRKTQTSVIGGTTANAGKPVPITYGRVFNISPVLIDDATFRYKFHDESTAGYSGISQVRDLGASVSFTDLGGGEFTLSATPDDVNITMDVNVDLSAGSALHAGNTHARALQTVLETRAGFGSGSSYLGLRNGSLAKFGADPTDEMGLYLDADANIMDVMDQISISAGGFWYFNRLGLLCAGLIGVPAGPIYDHSLIEDDVENFKIEQQTFLPQAVEQLGYRKNWTPQTQTFAGVVTIPDQAKYRATATYTAVVGAYTGLDQPSNHKLQGLPVNRDTLFTQQADAEAEAARNAMTFGKLCVLVTFSTKTDSVYYNLGESLLLTYPRFGFDQGKAGIIVGLDEDFEQNLCTVTIFVQIQGQFPLTSSASPYVTLADYY